MIAKITKGSDFVKAIGYLLNPEKNHKIITGAKQCWGNTASEISAGLKQVAEFRPTTKLPVRHFAIGFAPDDGNVDDDLKAEIVIRIMEEMGYGDCQYFAVNHDRYDPNHHKVHNHDHIHIIANAITVHGERVRDFKDYYDMEKCLRKIEKDYGLTEVESSWEKVKRLRGISAPTELRDKIDRSLKGSPNLGEWIDKLEVEGVNLKFRISKNGLVQGVSYVHKNAVYKGGDTGHSWRSISPNFEQTSENLELIESANVKARTMPIQLEQKHQELFDKAINLAIQKLDGKSKFKDKSISISIEENILTVQRLRPNKMVLSGKRNETGEWKSIGWVNFHSENIFKF